MVLATPALAGEPDGTEGYWSVFREAAGDCSLIVRYTWPDGSSVLQLGPNRTTFSGTMALGFRDGDMPTLRVVLPRGGALDESWCPRKFEVATSTLGQTYTVPILPINFADLKTTDRIGFLNGDEPVEVFGIGSPVAALSSAFDVPEVAAAHHLTAAMAADAARACRQAAKLPRVALVPAEPAVDPL